MSKHKERTKSYFSGWLTPFYQVIAHEKKLLTSRKEEFKQGQANSNQEVRHKRDREFLHRGLVYLGLVIGLYLLLELLSRL